MDDDVDEFGRSYRLRSYQRKKSKIYNTPQKLPDGRKEQKSRVIDSIQSKLDLPRHSVFARKNFK